MDQVICTVDVVLLTLKDNSLSAALQKRRQPPFENVEALPGGYIHADKDASARDAALRVIASKTGIVPPYLEQLSTFSGPTRDPRGWSVSIAHYALVPYEIIERHSEMRLVKVDQLPALPFDHASIIATAVERLRNKSQYSSLPCFLVGECFTLPALQKVYEALMGEALNKVSFRRKMAEMDMLETVDGQFEAAGAHRPAQLYRLRAPFRQQVTMLERGL